LPLDRYEIVGIAVPGAGLVAVLVWFCKIDGFPDLTKTTLGSLGLFTIAAFVAGHVVQSIANTAEDLYKRFRRLPELISPSEYVPLQRADVEKGLNSLNLCWNDGKQSNRSRRSIFDLIRHREVELQSTSAKTVNVSPIGSPAKDGEAAEQLRSTFSLIGEPAKELRRLILSRIRSAKRSRLLDNLKITVAVNRGLCVVSLVFVLLAGIQLKYNQNTKPSITLITFFVIAMVIALASGTRARRYTMQFEREIWVQFGELSSDDVRGPASPKAVARLEEARAQADARLKNIRDPASPEAHSE
jgi:hypothetical protein